MRRDAWAAAQQRAGTETSAGAQQPAGALLGPLLAGSAQPHQVRRAAQGLGLPERGRYAVVVLGTAAMVPDGDRDGARWCWCGEVGWSCWAGKVWTDRPGRSGRPGRGRAGSVRWWAVSRSWGSPGGSRVRRC
ncbi:hypothetical protein ACN24K_25160 [Streptomyces microflavus]